MPKLLTRKEYQEHFGVSRQAVCNGIQQGRLKTVMAPVESRQEMIVVDDDKYNAVVNTKHKMVVDTGKREE